MLGVTTSTVYCVCYVRSQWMDSATVRYDYFPGVHALYLIQVTDGLSELKDVDRASVYEAGKELANAAVKVLTHGLTMPDREVCGIPPCRRCCCVEWCRLFILSSHVVTDPMERGEEVSEASATMPACERRMYRNTLVVFISLCHGLSVFNAVVPEPSGGTPNSLASMPPSPGV